MKTFYAAVAALVLAFSGCATVKMSREGGHTVVVIENTGWFLFNFIPLGSGNPNDPNTCSCRFFQNTVKLENNMLLLENTCKTEGAKKAKNIVTYTTDEKVFLILLKRLSFHTTAELIDE